MLNMIMISKVRESKNFPQNNLNFQAQMYFFSIFMTVQRHFSIEAIENLENRGHRKFRQKLFVSNTLIQIFD